MHKRPEFIHVGQFTVKDGELVVSDPCYDRSTWCAGAIDNVKLGTWNAYVAHGPSGWGNRVWELVIVHSDYPVNLESKMNENSGIDVGVDSGQAGFYDLSSYHGGEDDYEDNGGWYRQCCDITLDGEYSAGVLPGGCVSSTGFGDGSYDCFIVRDGTTEVTGAKIVFITEDEA